jgi:nucleotide-binding universal stress UspA family protein
MEKKVLIAVDGSQASMAALEYVAMMEAAVIPELSVALLHLIPPIPPAMRQDLERSPSSFRLLQDTERKHRARGQEVLERAMQRLLDLGMEREKIVSKFRPRGLGLAKDILFEGEKGLYDAVVLGRRGLSKVQEMFLGSVTNKVVQHADRLPVWVVGGTVDSCKILCAVDASEGSLKAVDHLAFMLAGNLECRITLFHAGLGGKPPGEWKDNEEEEASPDLVRRDLSLMEDFYAESRRVLAEAGLKPGQVSLVTREGRGSVWRVILEEAREGCYGTVVLGRRGEGRSYWLGHVCDKIVSRLAEAAVWVVG